MSPGARPRVIVWLAAVVASLLLGLANAPAYAKAKAVKAAKPKTKTAATSARARAHGKGTKSSAPRKGAVAADAGDTGFFLHRPSNVVPNQHGKVVIFPFRDDDDGQLSTQVGELLEARGLEIVTGVRRVDSPEQYRDVATQLDLVAYVDGDVRGTEAKTKATIRLRDGHSGRPVSQATFSESRSDLARALSDNLWKKLGRAMARACADADKPRKASRTTLRINAGVPLDAPEADPFADASK